jgi:sugar lactone lactonase YvrE
MPQSSDIRDVRLESRFSDSLARALQTRSDSMMGSNARCRCSALGVALVLGGCTSTGSSSPATASDTSHPWKELALIAGQPAGPGWVDGASKAAHFTSPYAVALGDAAGGHLYVLDENAVRDVDLAGSEVSTLAGQPGVVGSVDGVGEDASFFHPTDAVVSGGALYLCDTEVHVLRKVDLATAKVTTSAGVIGELGNVDATGAAARFQEPEGVAIDEGTDTLYVGDTDNHTIRKVDLATMDVTTIAGAAGVSGAADGVGAAARFARPTTVTLDLKSRSLFISDAGNQLVRRLGLDDLAVSTVAGFEAPAAGLAMDGADLLVAFDSQIVRVNPTTREVTPWVGSDTAMGLVDGTGDAARFSSPRGMKNDGSGTLFVADPGNWSVRKVDLGSGDVATVAGASSEGAEDGVGAVARFAKPKGVAVTSGGVIYVADTENHAIRTVAITSGETHTVAGVLGESGSADGPLSSARFNRPSGLALDGDKYLYVAELGNHDVRRIDLSADTVSTLAVVPAASTPDAVIQSPLGLAFEDEHLYLTDGAGLLAIDLRKQELRQIAKDPGDSSVFAAPTGIAADAKGDVYVADALANVVVRVAVATGAVTTFIGRPSLGSSASSTRLYYPSQLALRSDGTLFVADSQTVRQATLSDAKVKTVVGSIDRLGVAPGPLPAQLGSPTAIALGPEGHLVIVSENAVLVAR